MKLGYAGVLILATFSSLGLIYGHHSLSSEFDEGKPLTLKGVITRVEWVNPHVYLYMDVKDGNGKTEWSLETLPPAVLRRNGLRKDMLGAGQEVTVLGYTARAAKNLAFLRKITFADGHEVVIWVGDVKAAEQAAK
jgi:Family of unknown function (DUF6152)